MSNRTEYKVVQATSIEDLEKQIAHHTKFQPHLIAREQWRLLGGVSVAPFIYSEFNPNTSQYETRTDLMYHQALFKE